jgi:hypothetical protein
MGQPGYNSLPKHHLRTISTLPAEANSESLLGYCSERYEWYVHHDLLFGVWASLLYKQPAHSVVCLLSVQEQSLEHRL